MCGIVGIAGGLSYADERIFEALLVADYLRGTDSTGVAAFRKSGEVKVVKRLGHPFNLIGTKEYAGAVNGPATSVLLGHNRYTTSGASSIQNAHPFNFDHITGVHNGTLSWESHGALDKLAGREYPVDSMSLYAALAKVGIDEVAKVLEGAFAMVWIDAKEETLNFWRNDERPLWYCFSKTKKILGWASKHPYLSYGFGSFDIDFETDEKGYCFFPFKEDTLYSWEIRDLLSPAKTVAPVPNKRPLKAKGGTPVWMSYGGSSSWGEWGPSSGGSETSNKKRSRVAMLGSSASPYAGVVLREEFEDISKDGCSFCRNPVLWGSKNIIIDTVNGEILCDTCSPGTSTVVRVTEREFDVVAGPGSSAVSEIKVDGM